MSEMREMSEMTNWISIKDRLPTEKDAFYTPDAREYALVCLKYGLTTFREIDILYICDFDNVYDYFMDSGVTHWLSVPRKP